MAQKSAHSTPAKKTVALATTPEKLSTSHVFAEEVTIQALRGNTGLVCVGDSNVDFTNDRGLIIAALNTVTLRNVYLDEIWLDVETNAEGVSYWLQAERDIIT